MAKQKDVDPAYADRRAHYERLVASVPGVDCKGDANRYTAVNGNMSSYLHSSGSMALRLPAGVREAFQEEHRTTLFEAYGVVQKEYVRVPDDLLADTSRLQPAFRASLDYVGGLKSKPTRKPPKIQGSDAPLSPPRPRA